MPIEATKTAELFAKITRDDTKWSPYRQMVANVFNAFHTRAFSVEQVELIARAVDGLPEASSLQDALSFYVRHKVLRTRRGSGGKKLYEVNF